MQRDGWTEAAGGRGSPCEGGRLHLRGEVFPHFFLSSLGASVSLSCPGALAGTPGTPLNGGGEKAHRVRPLVSGILQPFTITCDGGGGRRADALSG